MCFAPQLTIKKVERDNVLECHREELTIGVVIGDRPCVALLDSGSDRTLIRQDSLPRDVVFCGGTVDVFCIHGDKVAYPIAEVTIQVNGQQYTLLVGVFEHLPYQVVLGCDVPTLAELIARQSCETRASCTSDSLLAVTRSKSSQEQASSTGGWEELLFAEQKSRRQWRQEKLRGTKVAEHAVEPRDSDIFAIPGDIAKLQRETPQSQPCFLNVCLSHPSNRERKGSVCG